MGGHDASASWSHRLSDGTGPVGEPPSPAGVRTLDELVTRLGRLRGWSGLGYREVHRRVVELRRGRGVPEQLSFNTVYRCMQPGRSRLDVEVVVDVARVLLGDDAAVAAWRMAYQALSGQARAAAIVRVHTAVPHDLSEFTGRRAELQQLLDGLTSRRLNATPAVAVIEGMAGVGKTTLAIHAGHQLLQRGLGMNLQLWVNLRGNDPELPPADPAAVLDGFLRILEISGDQIFHLDLADRAARYRQLLTGRRALIVLDNAANQEQVTPLLPHTAGSVTMITSRNTLANLADVWRLPLDMFSETEALDLLRRTVGRDRVDAAARIAADIARLVGCLPLALGVVAGRINQRPEWTLADHLARLTERTQLRQLDSGIELALESSYRALGLDLQQMLRLLALHCGRDFDAHAAAALAGTDLPITHQSIDSLVAANLLQRPTPTRYHLHDLIQVYASARAIDDEPDSARQAALTRLFDSYLFTASQAADTLYPVEQHQQPPIPAPSTPAPEILDGAAAMTWLSAEHSNLLAAVAHTAAHGWSTHTARFGATLSRWLYVRGYYADALAVNGHALDAARKAGDRTAEGVALLRLGWIRQRLGQYRAAAAALGQALLISREMGDQLAEGKSREGLGVTNAALGRFREALEHHSAAIATFRQLDNQLAQGRALNNIGDTYERMGHYEKAITHYQQALAISRDIGNQVGVGIILGGLSSVYARLRRLPEAQECHRQALTLDRQYGHRGIEALNRSLYGLVHGVDDPDTEDHHQRAVAIARETGAPRDQTVVFNNIGEALRTNGRYGEALQHHRSALEVASQVGERLGQARAHDGIAHVMHATDQPDQARTHWQKALAFYTELGTRLAGEVQARLDALEVPDPVGQRPSLGTCSR